MSKTIDERVVEMRFDNKQFESNVKTSMSTIERLKESLKFKGIEKGFGNVNEAVKKCDVTPLSKAIDKVSIKFSALEVAGITAMANITNSVFDAGKRLASSLSVDQISAGWKKYGEKTSAVQTIIAATGKSIDKVNASLEKLNWFTDETSYNLLDMTNNIGKFTSNGIELDTSVTAMEGIANAAALSGSGIENASHAMEGFSKAIAQGSMTRINWNWIKTARMDTQQFKESMIEAGLAAGTLVKVGNNVKTAVKGTAVSFQDFESAMSEGWMTTEVIINALGTYGGFTDKLYQACEKTDMTASELLESIEKYKEGTLDLNDISKESGVSVKELTSMYEELGSETLKLGQKSFRAAQEAKTFSEAIDSVKDAVSTGWMNTFELIFGNYEQAKSLWTDLANTLYDVFAEGGNKRNAILKEALSSPFEKLTEKISALTKTTGEEVKQLDNYEEIINKIIKGDFGNGIERIEKLTELGLDYGHAQNLVNKALGSSIEHITDYLETQSVTIEEIKELTDAELENLGWTEQEIKTYRELEKQSKSTGKTINELIAEMDVLDGRTLLINSFKNIGGSLIKILEKIKEAWRDVFTPLSSSQLYKTIKSFNEFSKKLSMSDKTAEKLRRTLRGLFSIIDLIFTMVGGPIKIAIKIVSKLLGSMNVDILEVTASIGDAIFNFRNWLKSFIDFDKIASDVGNWIKNLVIKFKEWIAVLKESDNIPRDIFSGIVNAIKKVYYNVQKYSKPVADIITKFSSDLIKNARKYAGPVENAILKFGSIVIQKFKDIGSKITAKSIFGDKIKGFIEIAGHLLTGLIKGIENKLGPVGDAIVKIGNLIIDKIKEVLGINSPSRVFFWIGQMIVMGLVGGIIAQSGDVVEPIKSLGEKCLKAIKSVIEYFDFKAIGEWIKNGLKSINLADILLIAFDISLIKFANKALDTVNAVTKTVDKFAAPFAGMGKLLTAVADRIKPDKWNTRADAILKIAIAIDLLVGAVILLAKIYSTNEADLWKSVGLIAALGGILTVFSFASSKITASTGNFSAMILSISASLYIMAKALKQLDFINDGNADAIYVTLFAMVTALGAIIGVLGTFVKGKTAANVDKAALMIMSISVSMFIMAKVLKQFSDMEWADIGKGLAGIGAFTAVIGLLIAVSALAKNSASKVGVGILAISAAMILMTTTVKIMSGMDEKDIKKGYNCIIGFGLIITGLMMATRLASGGDAGKIGLTIIGIATAMALMAITVKIMSGMDEKDIEKGFGCIAAFGIVIMGLMAVTRLAGGENLKGVAATILAASMAIGIMAGVAILLSMLDLKSLAKGITAVSVLGAIMALMIHATKGAENCQKSIIAMAIAIGVMTASVVMLSMIDPAKLANATLALSAVMGMFALVEFVAERAKDSMGSIIAMSIAVGLIGGILYLLAGLPIESVLVSSAALSLLLMSLSVSLAIISKFGNNIANSIAGAIGLLALAVPLVAFVGILALMQGIQNAENNAKVLANFTAAMVIVLGVLTILGLFAEASIAGVISLLALAVPLVAFVGILALMQGIQNAENNAKILTSFMTAMTEVLIKISLLAPFALVGVAAITAMIPLIGIMGGLIIAVCTLTKYFPQLEQFISSGISLLSSLANGIGLIIGNFIGGALAGISSGLPEVATNLSLFMLNLTPFISGAKMIDGTLIDNIKKLVELILMLTGAELLSSITSWLAGGDSLGDFGKKLIPFGNSMLAFSRVVRGIKDEDIENIEKTVTAGKAMVELAKMIPNSGGFLGAIVGNNDLDNFGEQLKVFGEAIVNYSNAVLNIDTSGVDESVKAGKALAELNDAIPNSSGFLGAIVGNNDLDTFGSQLKVFGEAIVEYCNAVKEIDTTGVIESVKAGRMIAKLNEAIPNSGGFAGLMAGNNDLDTFGEQLEKFGTSIVDYCNAVKEIDASGVSTSLTVGKSLARINKITMESDSGGNIGLFGSQLKGFGEAIVKYCKAVLNIDTSGVDKSIEASNAVLGLTNELANTDISYLKSFGTNLSALGKGFAEFSKKMKNVDGISDIASQIESFGNAMANLGKTGVDKLVNAFSGGPSKMRKEAEKMIKAFISTMKAGYDSFKASGKYVVEGFAKGIDENRYLAIAKVKVMVQKAIKTAHEEFDENSPSKVFIGIGKNVVEGLARGIADKRQMSRVTSNTVELAGNVIDSAKSKFKINSPSKAFIEIGKHIGEGLAQGIRDSAWLAVNSVKEVADDVISISKAKFEDIEKYIENENFYDNMTPEKEIEIWEAAVKRYEKGSEEYEKANKNLYTAYKNFYKKGFEDIKNYISNEEDYNRMSTKRKLEIWKEAQQQYKWGTEERKEIDKNVYKLTHELIDDDTEALKAYRKELEETISTLEKGTPLYWEKLAEKENLDNVLIPKSEYDDSKKWEEEEDFYGKIDLSRKVLADGRRLQKYGFLDEKELKHNFYTSQKALYDSYLKFKEDIEALYKDAGEKRAEIEKEYDKKVLDIKQEYNDKIAEEDEKYNSELKSRTKTLYDSYGLFDEIKKKNAVSGATLMKNLQDQVDEFDEWQKTLNSLSARGLNEALIEELQDMGPSSTAEIKALNSMTDSQLQQYATLWSTKYRQANERATYELESMRATTNSTIKSLKQEMNIKLGEADDDLDADLKKLNDTVTEKAENIKNDWLKEVGVIKKDTDSEMREMETIVASILGAVVQNAGEEGKNLVLNYAGNIADNAWVLYSTIEDIMSNAAKMFDYDSISDSTSTVAQLSAKSWENFNKAIENKPIHVVRTISPVVNLDKNTQKLNGIFSGEQVANINSSLSLNNQNGNSEQQTMINKLQKVIDYHEKITSTLSSINDRVNRLSDEMEEMQIVMDTGALVGAIAPNMDEALGGIAKMNRRGAI